MDYRTPRHDERLAPCPICEAEPWADSRSGTIYCDCGLRLRLNGDCSPEWHRMDWTADEWNGIAKLKEENAKLRELIADMHGWLVVNHEKHYVIPRNGLDDIEREMQELGIEVTDE